jgi:hypothetical protein
VSGHDFRSILKSWEGSEITVINPESFKSTPLGLGLGFQSYTAKLSEVGEDYIKLSYTAIKKDVQTDVEQVVPISLVKRISVWGEERLVHL